MYIGEASKRSGASARAIRLYERLGLLKINRLGSYRTYSDADIEFIKLIKEGQSLGLQLEEMVELKQSGYDLDWRQLNQLLIQKQQVLNKQITTLQAQATHLKEYQQSVQRCVDELDSLP